MFAPGIRFLNAIANVKRIAFADVGIEIERLNPIAGYGLKGSSS